MIEIEKPLSRYKHNFGIAIHDQGADVDVPRWAEGDNQPEGGAWI